jgi:hypothetical protein
MDWQPIETAPKGDLLLYFPRVWNKSRHELKHAAMMQIGCVAQYPFRVPSHWMALPDAPTQTGGRDD